jgi:hypothetical protein
MWSTSRSRSVATSSFGYAGSVSTAARISSVRSSPEASALPVTSRRSGSSPAESPPPTAWSSAAMSTLDIVPVPVNSAWDSSVARGSGARPKGTRSRSSTSGTAGRRMAITVSPEDSVRSACGGSLSLASGIRSGRVLLVMS